MHPHPLSIPMLKGPVLSSCVQRSCTGSLARISARHSSPACAPHTILLSARIAQVSSHCSSAARGVTPSSVSAATTRTSLLRLNENAAGRTRRDRILFLAGGADYPRYDYSRGKKTSCRHCLPEAKPWTVCGMRPERGKPGWGCPGGFAVHNFGGTAALVKRWVADNETGNMPVHIPIGHRMRDGWQDRPC